MLFELTNAPASFQTFINDTLRAFLRSFATAYLNDVLVYSDTLEEHKVHVRRVVDALTEAGLYLNSEKCKFYQRQVEYLGFIVSNEGVTMDSAKIKAIIE